MTVGILVVDRADGSICGVRNMWLESFNHEAYRGRGYGTFTSFPEKAMRFADSAAAMEFWRKQSTVTPLRPDGKPNRPLTAFTVLIEQLP